MGQQQPPAPAEPPEEDETMIKEKKEYEFNPLQAQKEIKIGLFYMKKGSYRAAEGRFLEASLWDPTSAEALYKLGEARERMGDHKGKRAAWVKFLELAPEDKRAAEVRKKLDSPR
jgi:tetratricopeptide (TPR) repeat protein